MIALIGVSGLAGSGKSTAVEHLVELTGGRLAYLGQTVLDEVCARGLPKTPENERQVRIDLRREKGLAAFAIPFVHEVVECVTKRIPVFVDAIFTREEFDVLVPCVPIGSARLLAIEASFATRSARLASRPVRPIGAEELLKRDHTELEELGTGDVIAAAEHKIPNEGTLEEFYRRLEACVSCWA